MIRPIGVRRSFAVLLGCLLGLAPLTALPDETPPAPPAPYSLPWQLRAAAPANVVRLDTALAFHTGAVTDASMLFASYKVIPSLAPFVRFGYVANALNGQPLGNALVNPALGATYGLQLPASLRLGFFLGLTIPVGMGGGNSPDKVALAAAKSGVLARSAMDNAMFAVNDFTVFPGVDLAWVAHGFTVQVEATALFLTRVRGELAQADKFKLNLTSGLHVGYFVLPFWSLGAELRYQAYLTTPVAVAAAPATRDNLTFAAGTRFHVKVGPVWLRPGIAYARGLDAPMSTNDYNILFVDLPIAF